MSTRGNPSPGRRREGPERGPTHARIRARLPAERGRGRALAALNRWQVQYAEQAADPLDTLAAYADWIRAEIKLVRKLWGSETDGYVEQMAGTMHEWALSIDRQIRQTLGEPQ